MQRTLRGMARYEPERGKSETVKSLFKCLLALSSPNGFEPEPHLPVRPRSSALTDLPDSLRSFPFGGIGRLPRREEVRGFNYYTVLSKKLDAITLSAQGAPK